MLKKSGKTGKARFRAKRIGILSALLTVMVILSAASVLRVKASNQAGQGSGNQNEDARQDDQEDGNQESDWNQPKTGVEIASPTMMYAVKKVNIRKEPGTSAEQIGQLEEGERIFAVELTEEGWYRVTYEGETGYIRKDFLAVYTVDGEWNEPFGEGIDGDGQAAEEQGGQGQDAAGIQGAQPGQPEESEGKQEESRAGEADQSAGGNEAALENSEDGENGQDGSSEQPGDQEGSSSKSGISNIVIIVLVVVIIVIYAAVQITKERKGEGSEAGDSEKREKKAETAKREESRQKEAEKDLIILDLDAEEKH